MKGLAGRLAAPSSYWAVSRTPRYSFTFALPLLVAYEGLAAALGGAGGLRNGADVIIKSLFAAALGPWGPALFGAALVLWCAWRVSRDRRGGALRPRILAAMLVESAVLALTFGSLVGATTARILDPLAPLSVPAPPALDAFTRLTLSLGAGLYEELLFRVLLVGTLAWGARRLLGWPPAAAGAMAVGIGALVFSAFHYVGPYGDRWALDSFTYRAVAGVFLSALYVTRGFGITAWTHALYDVLVLVVLRIA
ncbi:MAG TPA: CPBP family intramembrane glutamic endopeptidase [Gemmatimonadaceae bacterium]|nr:CPBP family intramembrane glutamic endopeptidase [Gemmatimonadaceae bacterium]